MVHSGFGLWIVWKGQLDPGFNTMLVDYGGCRLAEESGQALWFFLGDEALRVLGRILVWGRVTPMPVFLEAVPATMQVGPKFERTLSISVELSRQNTSPPDGVEVFIHPNLKGHVPLIPGLTSEPVKPGMGLARVAFERLVADPGLAYESGLNWLCVIHPLGDPLSRETAGGWRNIAAELVDVMDRLGMKFLRHEGFLISETAGLRLFRSWCRDTITRIARLKEEGEESRYWPSVLAAVPAKGRSLSKDLPHRLGLDWNKLAPDFPHMPYRSAFLLGEDFLIQEARYLSRGVKLDDWCSVNLVTIQDVEPTGALAVPLPGSLSGGEARPCFYCGLTNHEARQCPSKSLAAPGPEIWDRFGQLDIGRLEDLSKGLESAMAADLLPAMAKSLAGDQEKDVLLRAIFEIDMPAQTRMLETVWRSLGKEMPAGLAQRGPREGEFVWDALAALRSGNGEAYEAAMSQALLRYPRAYQPKSLQGFYAMEGGDWTKATYYWQESARLCYTALQRCYFLFLQARALETQEDYHKAIALYRDCLGQGPRWTEPVYRQGVCLVKMGFTDQGMQYFSQLLRGDTAFFNRVMVDPELERGRLQVLSALWRIWKAAQDEVKAHLETLAGLSESVRAHFLDGEPYLTEIETRVQELGKLSKVNNYVSFKRLDEGVSLLREEYQKKLDAEIKVMGQNQTRQFEDLKGVQREAAWFPFPALLHEFNRDFNFCAAKLNWMRTAPMAEAENFHKAREYLPQVDERIRTLRTRLITLRIVRDSTFFVMLLGRNFMWMEVAGLGLSLVLVPVFVYLFQSSGQAWVANMVEQQKWQLQKGLVVILSIAALALAAVKTALTFDGKKRKLFKLAEEGKLPKKKPKARKSVKAKPRPKAKPKSAK
jgi:tetratricopeptide (TPR) repeat protein